jgi:hypothetical protein
LTEDTSPLRRSPSLSRSRFDTPGASQSFAAITSPARSPKSTASTTSASESTATQTSGSTSPTSSTTSRLPPSLITRSSVYTVVCRPASTRLIILGRSIAFRKCRMRGPCVTCYGPTQMTAVAGEYLLVVRVTHSARIFPRRSTITMVLPSLQEPTSWLWRAITGRKTGTS